MPEIFRRRLRPSESLKFSVGRILESDILGIAAMDCNDGSIKDFVGYKYPTYACYVYLLFIIFFTINKPKNPIIVIKKPINSNIACSLFSRIISNIYGYIKDNNIMIPPIILYIRDTK